MTSHQTNVVLLPRTLPPPFHTLAPPPPSPRLPTPRPQVIFYPTAIGSEPQDTGLNSYPHWTRTMLGHAAANLVGWARADEGPSPRG